MPTYPVNPSDPTSPTDQQGAKQGAEEFRALKALIASMVVAASASAGPRQAIQSAVLDANGYNNALTVGAGLRPGLTASAVDPYHLSIANGFNTGKAINSDESIVANVADIIGADLPVSNTSYLYRNYGTDYNSTLIPPQYGYAFDRTQGVLMNFEGNNGAVVTTDDFGNAVVLTAATITTAQFKFGTSALDCTGGTAKYATVAAITSLGDGAWEISGWFRPTTQGVVSQPLIHPVGSTSGIKLYSNVGGNVKINLYLSSDGATDNISAGAVGATVLALNTWYKYRLVFDPLAGNYKLYLSNNGGAETTECTVASTARICAISGGLRFGASNTAADFFIGQMDAIRFVRAATVTASQVPAVVAPTITDYKYNFFSIPKMQMFEVTTASAGAGINPTFTSVLRLFLGEADTSGAAVTAIRNYAIRGEYVSPETAWAASSIVTLIHNIGLRPQMTREVLRCISPEGGYTVGDEIPILTDDNAGNAFNALCNKQIVGHVFGPAGQTVAQKATFVRFTPGNASWKYVAKAKRDW